MLLLPGGGKKAACPSGKVLHAENIGQCRGKKLRGGGETAVPQLQMMDNNCTRMTDKDIHKTLPLMEVPASYSASPHPTRSQQQPSKPLGHPRSSQVLPPPP